MTSDKKNHSIEELIKKVSTYLSDPNDLQDIRKAYEYAVMPDDPHVRDERPGGLFPVHRPDDRERHRVQSKQRPYVLFHNSLLRFLPIFFTGAANGLPAARNGFFSARHGFSACVAALLRFAAVFPLRPTAVFLRPATALPCSAVGFPLQSGTFLLCRDFIRNCCCGFPSAWLWFFLAARIAAFADGGIIKNDTVSVSALYS